MLLVLVLVLVLVLFIGMAQRTGNRKHMGHVAPGIV
jgi:hypothetical protein